MSNRHHERVQERAYHLWRESGGEHGRAFDHWLQAEEEIRTDRAEAAEAEPAKAKAKSAKAPKKAEKAPGKGAKAASKEASKSRPKRPASSA
ncbi:DUF2934 domain-containing protein [Enterovirga rhinocerotis]|uniref:DUF2934 family protein n=1 Tax=Enterovirga rhinocerotis TaxID=1339210 RepID=A0A4R7BX13_9HYPH|nr:DUF2934 domain-containing protein [Enterovirga rhinocerotis]TDR89742.1 DUF2934 family protein [Enterovirga rhinocerotis]